MLKYHIIFEFGAAHIVPRLAEGELILTVDIFKLFALCFNEDDVSAFCSYGSTGATGQQGEKGDTGSQGPQGEKGDKGDPGNNVMRKYSASSVPPDGLLELDDGTYLTLDTDDDLELQTGGEWHQTYQNGDLYVIESTDGGTTWTAPVLMTDVIINTYTLYAISEDGETAYNWTYDKPEVQQGKFILTKTINVYESGTKDETVLSTYYSFDSASLQTDADSLHYTLRRDGTANYQEMYVEAFVAIEAEKLSLKNIVKRNFYDLYCKNKF